MKSKVLKVGKKVLIVIICIWLVLVAIGAVRKISRVKTEEQIVKIHATKLTLDDVMGKNLPPDPGADADKTIAGIDANHNGIRDDVELAIFKAYPDSAKIRMPLLQYALSMQLQMTLSTLNTETFTATVADTDSRANVCTWTLSSRDGMNKFTADLKKYRTFVEKLQLNNDARKKYLDDVYENMRSYSSSNDGCDIDPTTLPN